MPLAAIKRRTTLVACSMLALLVPATAARADAPFPRGFWSAPLAADAPLEPDLPGDGRRRRRTSRQGRGLQHAPVEFAHLPGVRRPGEGQDRRRRHDTPLPDPAERAQRGWRRSDPARRPALVRPGRDGARHRLRARGLPARLERRQRARHRARMGVLAGVKPAAERTRGAQRFRGASPRTATRRGTSDGAGASATPAPALAIRWTGTRRTVGRRADRQCRQRSRLRGSWLAGHGDVAAPSRRHGDFRGLAPGGDRPCDRPDTAP